MDDWIVYLLEQGYSGICPISTSRGVGDIIRIHFTCDICPRCQYDHNVHNPCHYVTYRVAPRDKHVTKKAWLYCKRKSGQTTVADLYGIEAWKAFHDKFK